MQWAREDLPGFQRRCGSAFVSAIYGGAKLTATLTVQAKTKSEKAKQKVEISGSGWGARLKGKVESSTDTENSSSKMDISIFMTGGKGDAIPATKDDLLAKLQTISLDAYIAPKDFQIAISPYELLENWPGVVIADNETEFDELASYWGAYNTIYDEIEAILASPDDYFQMPVPIAAEDEVSSVRCQSERHQYNEKARQVESLITPKDINQYVKDLNGLKTALDRCLSKQVSEIKYVKVNLNRLRQLQDQVHEGMVRMEKDARNCADRSDHCSFDSSHYRSPYAFRIQLPLPRDAELRTIDDVVYFNVGRVAKSQCAVSITHPGCLKNSEIYQWLNILGRTAVDQQLHADEYNTLKIEAEKIEKTNTEAGLPYMRDTDEVFFESGYDKLIWKKQA